MEVYGNKMEKIIILGDHGLLPVVRHLLCRNVALAGCPMVPHVSKLCLHFKLFPTFLKITLFGRWIQQHFD